MNSVLNSALTKVSRQLGVDKHLVTLVYKSYWKFIREYISELDFSDITEEEFNAITTNFNIPYIGKLYTNYDKIQKYNRKINYFQNVKAKKNKANRLSSVSD